MKNGTALVALKQQMIKNSLKKNRVKFVLEYGPVAANLLSTITFHLDVNEEKGYYLTAVFNGKVGRIHLPYHLAMFAQFMRPGLASRQSHSLIFKHNQDVIDLEETLGMTDDNTFYSFCNLIESHFIIPYLPIINLEKSRVDFSKNKKFTKNKKTLW